MTTFDKIKEILKNGSGRCVVLYNDDPHYVAMTWQEYRKFVNIEKTGEIKNNEAHRAEFFRSRISSFAPRQRLGASEGLFSPPLSPQQAAGYSTEENKKTEEFYGYIDINDIPL